MDIEAGTQGQSNAEDDAALLTTVSDEARADEFEIRVQKEANEHFQRLKTDAQAIYGAVKGRPGVSSAEKWAEMLERAGDEIGNGRFLVRCLGAERYLEPETVAVLLTLRQNLLADRPYATAGDIMMIDGAIMGYYNMLRTQRWIGNLSLVVERELFGQEPLNEIHGPAVGDRMEQQLRRLAEVMLPLQDRAVRMMTRSLEALRSAAIAEKNGRRRRLSKAGAFPTLVPIARSA